VSFKILISDKTHLIQTQLDWCNANCIGEFTSETWDMTDISLEIDEAAEIIFENEQDLSMFILRWGSS